MPSIFMSYRRRGEGSGYAHRLADALNARFGEEQLFKDMDDIAPGVDFVAELDRAVSAAKVLIVVIGPGWSQTTNAEGRRRLDDPNDFVRLEVAAALEQDTRVIPVLVGGASMPTEADLPAELAPLARRQAHELSDTRWDYDL